MKNMNVSSRLMLLVAVSVVALVVQVAIALLNMSWLGADQDDGYRRAKESAEMQDLAMVGVELYQVVADSVINRSFDDAAKKWVHRVLPGNAALIFRKK